LLNLGPARKGEQVSPSSNTWLKKQAMHATTTVAGAMKGATKVMTAVNQQMDPAKQIKVMQDFQKHSAQMDMTTEMISDSIDGALDDDELEDETDDLTNQVLDEIGIDVAAQMSSAPKGKIGRKTRAEDAGSSGVDDLEQRMSTLRNS
jgi:charged multivesicular body protein 2B